jgi:hypothetical protein
VEWGLQQQSFIKYVVVSVVIRYAKELNQIRWNGVRKGAAFGLFVGWLTLVAYIMDSVAFIYGSILMSYDNQNTFDIGDILAVSDSYYKSTKKQL